MKENRRVAQERPAKKPDSGKTHALSVNYAAILLQLVENRGCDSNDLLAASGITKTELANPDGYINSCQYHALIHNALILTKEPALGLYYGQRLNISTHGLLGYAILSSPSLAKTAEITQKYISLSNRLIKPLFHFEHNDALNNTDSSIRIDGEIDDPLIYRFEMESSFTAIYEIWHDLLGNHKGLSGISFKYAEPEYAQVYTEFLDIPIQFNSPFNELTFSRQALAPLKRLTNPTILLTVEKQCELLLNKLEKQTENPPSLSQHIRQLLVQLPGNFLTQEQMAEHLNMTPRTMARQLEKENTSFKQILELIKKELALQYLTFTELTVDEIAYLLNYNDASNFTRAFKRWTGIRPSEYKCKKN